MALGGATLAQILKAGQWKSAAFMRYLDEQDIEKVILFFFLMASHGWQPRPARRWQLMWRVTRMTNPSVISRDRVAPVRAAVHDRVLATHVCSIKIGDAPASLCGVVRASTRQLCLTMGECFVSLRTPRLLPLVAAALGALPIVVSTEC